MLSLRNLCFVLINVVYVSQCVLAQGEVGVPFLLITPSPEANGMGGISPSTTTTNALSIISNPAHIGMFSFDNYFSSALYSEKTEWLPYFGQNDLRYSSNAFVAGLNIGKLITLPFGLSVGGGYSTIDLDLGKFVRTLNDPTPLGTFDAYESAQAYSFGIGAEYIVKFGLGFTSRNITSHLSPVGSPSDTSLAEARPHATDFGMILQIPVADLIANVRGGPVIAFRNTKLQFDITTSYTRTNVGDGVTYLDAAYSDPLPRQAGVGFSVDLGLATPVGDELWKTFTFTFAREVQDILVQRFSNGSWNYVSGFGQIRFFQNLFLGKWDGDVTLRKGWQINFAEIFYFRGGSVHMPGLEYKTSGFSIRTSGIFKLFRELDPTIQDMPILGFVIKHIDVHFDQSTEGETFSPRDGTMYRGFNIVLH